MRFGIVSNCRLALLFAFSSINWLISFLGCLLFVCFLNSQVPRCLVKSSPVFICVFDLFYTDVSPCALFVSWRLSHVFFNIYLSQMLYFYVYFLCFFKIFIFFKFIFSSFYLLIFFLIWFFIPMHVV